MKCLLAATSLLFLTAPALAQSRPFRLTLGGALTPADDTAWLGASLDVKHLNQSRVLSLYTDVGFNLGYGCGAIAFPNAPTAQTYSGLKAFGVSMRQPWGKGWMGAGVGSYETYFADCGSQDHRVKGPGGKLFAGFGGGLYFTEVTLTVPSVPRYAQFSLTVGLRL